RLQTRHSIPLGDRQRTARVAERGIANTSRPAPARSAAAALRSSTDECVPAVGGDTTPLWSAAMLRRFRLRRSRCPFFDSPLRTRRKKAAPAHSKAVSSHRTPKFGNALSKQAPRLRGLRALRRPATRRTSFARRVPPPLSARKLPANRAGARVAPRSPPSRCGLPKALQSTAQSANSER